MEETSRGSERGYPRPDIILRNMSNAAALFPYGHFQDAYINIEGYERIVP